MATRTVTDRGVHETTITFEKNGVTAPITCDVQIRESTGAIDVEAVNLTTALTAGERTTLLNLLVKVYNAATAAAGYA